MTIKLSSLAADLKRERDGEWIEPKEWPGLNPERPADMVALPGLAFHVRSTNHPPYVTARQAELEQVRQDYPTGAIPPDVMARIEGRLSVEHLLIGWRGLDVAYSPEAARDALAAEEHRVLRAMVFWCAGRVGRRRIEFEEGAAKN